MVSGDLPEFASFVTGVEAVVQRIRFKILTHRGEWFADPRKGLPWKTWVAKKPMPVGIVHTEVVRAIRSVRGVSRVLRSEATADAVARSITVTVEVEIDRQIVELEYALSAIEYGNVSPYITYRVIRALV